MVLTRQLDGLNYRKAQKRNSEKFKPLSQKNRQQLRQQGYKNLGWDNVCKSWIILQDSVYEPINLLDFAHKKAEARYQKAKSGNDLIEVLAAGKSVIESLKMKYQ